MSKWNGSFLNLIDKEVIGYAREVENFPVQYLTATSLRTPEFHGVEIVLRLDRESYNRPDLRFKICISESELKENLSMALAHYVPRTIKNLLVCHVTDMVTEELGPRSKSYQGMHHISGGIAETLEKMYRYAPNSTVQQQLQGMQQQMARQAQVLQGAPSMEYSMGYSMAQADVQPFIGAYHPVPAPKKERRSWFGKKK